MRLPSFHCQCTAKSKRSGRQCRNYACRDRPTCRMHGGTSRRGPDHPNFKGKGKSFDFLNLLQRESVSVRFFLFPKPLADMPLQELRADALEMRLLAQEKWTADEWARLLRTVRTLITKELAEITAHGKNATTG